MKKLPELDTSNLSYFYELFSRLDITQFPKNLDFHNASNISHMATYCKYLAKLPNNINTVKCTDFTSAFSSCESLVDTSNTTIDVYIGSEYETSIWTSFEYMFSSCPKLTKSPIFRFNLNNYNVNMSVNLSGMFLSCKALTVINPILPDSSPANWNIQINNINEMVSGVHNLSYESIINILKLLQYTSDMSSDNKVLLTTGLYWRLVDKITPEDITAYVTNNNWSTGLENADTYTIDAKLYDKDGNVVYDDLEDLIDGLGVENYIEYSESVMCNPANGYPTYYSSHDYDSTIGRNRCMSKLVKYNDLLSTKCNSFDYSGNLYMILSSSISSNPQELCRVYYDSVTEDEKTNKTFKFRTNEWIYNVRLTDALLTRLENLGFVPSITLSIFKYNSDNPDSSAQSSVFMSANTYGSIVNKHKFITSDPVGDDSYYNRIRVELNIYEPSDPDSGGGTYLFSANCTIDDDELVANQAKVYTITCDVE